MGSWREGTIGEAMRIKHGFAFKGEFFSTEGSHIVLTPGNFKAEGGLKFKGGKEKYYTGPIPEEFVLKQGDLLVAMTDLTQNAPLLGSAAIVPVDGQLLHNQRLGKVTDIDASLASKEFLYWLLNWEPARAQIRATATGATVKHTAPDRIYSVRVRFPPPHIQRLICDRLTAYNQLIENCERRTEVLDEMARALYREWFVELRYPGRQGGGKLAAGWRRAVAGDVADEVRRSVPKGDIASVVYVGLEHIPRRNLALDSWEIVAELGSNKLEFKAGEVLFGKIRPYFHKVAVAPCDGVCSADTFVIRPREPGMYGLMVGLVSSDEFVAHASATANGAKMPRANWDVMMQFPVSIPPKQLLSRFDDLMRPWLNEQRNLVARIRNLREARSLLLPRLLAGDLSVAEAV